jgi:serine/threonine protein phosphatase PrpC
MQLGTPLRILLDEFFQNVVRTNMGFDCVTRTHVGCRRKVNEDALLACAERGIWAVADGMGGHDAGEVASAMVVEALSECAGTGNTGERAAQAAQVLEQVNSRLITMSSEGEQQRTIGSTVVGLVAGERDYACFWAGDSRAYRARGGALALLTRDHSLVQNLVDAGILTDEQSRTHPNANVITRAVGANPALDVDFVSGDLRGGDVFLLASDGLTRFVTEDELQRELSQDDLQSVGDRLIDLVLARGAPDNVTLILVRAH